MDYEVEKLEKLLSLKIRNRRNNIDLILECLAVPSAIDVSLCHLKQVMVEIVNLAFEFNKNSSNEMNRINNEISMKVYKVFLDLIERGNSKWLAILHEWILETLGAIVESITSSNSDLENKLKHIQAAKAFYTNMQAVQMLMLPTFMNIVGKMLKDNNQDYDIIKLFETKPPYFDWLIVEIGLNFPEAKIVKKIVKASFEIFSFVEGNKKAERFSQILINLNFHCQNFPELIQSIDLKPRIKVLLYSLKMLEHYPSIFLSTADSIIQKCSTGNTFKERYPNHKKSFTNQKKRHATELSNNVWSLEDSIMNMNELFAEYKEYVISSSVDQNIVKHSIAKIVCKVCEKSFSTMEVFIRVNCNEIELKNKDLKNFSNDTLELIFKELEKLLLSPQNNFLRNGVFLYKEEIIQKLLSSENQIKKQSYLRIVKILCLKPELANELLSMLLVSSDSSNNHANIFIDIFQSCEFMSNGYLIDTVVSSSFNTLMKGNREKACKILKNLDKLFSYAEHNQHSEFINLLLIASKKSVDDLLVLLSRTNTVGIVTSHTCMNLLSRIYTLDGAPCKYLLFSCRLVKLAQTTCSYFFNLLHKNYNVGSKEVEVLMKFVYGICAMENKFFNLFCNTLFKQAFSNQSNVRLFGDDKHKVMDCNKTPCDVTKEKSMLEQLREKMRIVEANVRRRNTITKLQVESDVLRRRNVGKTSPVSKAQQLTSTYALVNLLQMLADGKQERLGVVAELFMNQLCASSLQMETFVSLYSAPNDWFSYKTIMKLLPRNLEIYNFMVEFELGWHIFNMTSQCKEEKLVCLVRSCLYVLLVKFENDTKTRPDVNSTEFKMACTVIKVLGKANYLPAPIKYVSELFYRKEVENYDVHLILNAVCTYLKERNSNMTDVLKNSLKPIQSIINRNISTMAPLYARFTFL